jgi:hypothetical protein
MTRPLDPFDFELEDDDDAATVLMSGHQRALLREALRTPAPLDALVLDGKDESEAASAGAAAVPLPVEEPDSRAARWVVLLSMAVLVVAVGMSSYAILMARH